MQVVAAGSAARVGCGPDRHAAAPQARPSILRRCIAAHDTDRIPRVTAFQPTLPMPLA